MAEIVNLRRFRKQKARAGREEAADANRRKHGMTAAEKKQRQAERELAERRLASHRIEHDDKVSKRSVTIAGHRTSISLEPPFWEALAEIAAGRGMSVAALVAEIDREPAGRHQPVGGPQDVRARLVSAAGGPQLSLVFRRRDLQRPIGRDDAGQGQYRHWHVPLPRRGDRLRRSRLGAAAARPAPQRRPDWVPARTGSRSDRRCS